MPKQVEAWQCDYCPKRYVSKASAKRHEKTCIFNPSNKACITCEHSYYKGLEVASGCRIGRIEQGGRWIKGCAYHKYQGCVGIDVNADPECTYEDYLWEDN